MDKITSGTGCGGNLTAPSGGPVTSPNYPGDYGNNETCEWLITVPEGSIIRLTFDSFHTENDDFLTIYDGASDNATEMKRLTGDHSQIIPIISTSNTMFMRFTSDDFGRRQGFKFNYKITNCGGNLAAPSGGPVTSPNYPGNYDNNETCEWLITVPEGSIIRLTFDSFHTEYDYDFLTIYDGASDNVTGIER
ncbi:CUB domain-containing protein 2-like [Branchiostoma floridae x Branchiostoma belcheri]